MPAPLRIALAAAECAPFAKTGGLADVTAALGRALWRRGHDVRVFLPFYRSIAESGFETEPHGESFVMEIGGRQISARLRRAALPNSEGADGSPLLVDLVDAPELFDREELYTDDEDESVRWAGFCRAIIEACQRSGWGPDIVHANDWHTGLLPMLLRRALSWDRLFAGTRTLFSIHNLGYQGVFGAEAIDGMGLGELEEQFHQDRLSAGSINLLETGLIHSHWLSTVSKTYAREIQTAEHGMGLEGALSARDDHLVGIVNGVDYDEWCPTIDSHIPAHFGPGDLSGKRVCRDRLLDELNLAPDPTGPVFGIVSRMTGQKGFDLLPDILPVFLQSEDVRLVVLGSGDAESERYFQWLRDSLPHKVGVYIGYKNDLAHRIEAGADIFLMPSRYEPCGLNQMYSLRYGTVPLVRATGGLADTVERWDPERREGTGFCFYEYSSDALHDTMRHALEVWRDRDAWSILQDSGMARDFSWGVQVQAYEDLYAAILAEHLT